MESIIKLQELNYQYPSSEEKNLNNINVEVEEGKFVVIMGPTGAGKTTLSLCCNGLIPQLFEGKVSGSVQIAGMDVSKYRVQTLSKHVGLVLQDPETQIFGMTVEEDTAFGPRNFMIEREEIFSRVKDALKRVRLSGYEKRNTTELSGGEKQRLAIAGTLAMTPEILILDEPTSELDPIGRQEIYATLDDLRREKNLTIMVIEHSSEEIIEKADQVVVLNHGEKVWEGTTRELFGDIDLLNRYGIKPLTSGVIGWALYKNGFISKDEIPLNVEEINCILKRLLGGRAIKQLREKPENRKEAETPIVLSVNNLVHKYSNNKKALSGVNLDIRQGEYVALIGQNGAGKTTLAKHFNGLLLPTEGDVMVNGMNTKTVGIDKLSRFIGYVFQNPDHQIFSTSVEKELEYGMKNIGIPESEMKEKIEKVLNFTGLLKHRDTHPFSLGKGERQLVAVASILAIEPQILVVDEPTTGLDWIGINNMMTLIDTLHKNGTTIIMVTHDMDIVAKNAHRVIVMKDGEICLDGPTEEVLSRFEVLREAYIAPPQVMQISKTLQEMGLSRAVVNEEELTAVVLGSLEGYKCL